MAEDVAARPGGDEPPRAEEVEAPPVEPPEAHADAAPVAENATPATPAPHDPNEDDDDDLLRLVAEETAEQHPPHPAPSAADDLSHTPFALSEPEPESEPEREPEPVAEAPPELEPEPEPEPQPEVEAAAESVADVAEKPAADEPEADEPPLSFGFGANQHFSLMESSLDWSDDHSLATLPPADPLFEFSLAGVHGAVEGVEPLHLPETPDEPPAQAAEIAEVSEAAPAHHPPEPTPAPPAEPDQTPRGQLLGFIRIDELPTTTTTPAAQPPLRQRGPIEPVRSVVQPSADDADALTPEPAVELPLETDEPAPPPPPSQPPSPPSVSRLACEPCPPPPSPTVPPPPNGLHAVRPPRAAYRITRGLSSLTGGGRAVDVFSQLPVVSEDPVLGKVSGPARIPPETDPSLAAPAPAPVPPPPTPTEEDLNAALSPQIGFDSPDPDAPRAPGGDDDAPPQPLFIRKLKRMFRERGGTLSIALAMAAAGATAYALTPAHYLVRAEVHYYNLDHLSSSARPALQARQRELLTDPAVLAAAADAVSAGPGAPDPGFLASPVAASRLVDRTADADLWPPKLPGTLALSLHSSDPDADVERLRALTTALVNAPANRRLAAAARASAARVDQTQAALATLDRDLDKLRHEQAAAQARLASADARGTDDVTTALPDPSPEERAWRNASLATLRAQSDLADLADKHVPPTDPRTKAAHARLAAARTAEAAARDRFVATQARPASATAINDDDDPAGNPARRAADVTASLHALQSRRTTLAADLQQLQSEAAAFAYPDPPNARDTWSTRLPDHRTFYALASAALVGLSLSAYRTTRPRRPM